MSFIIPWLRRLDRALVRAESAGVVLALTLMVALKFTDVVLRNAGQGGVPAFATVAQHLVLWVGMLGAALATSSRKHISIEVVGPYLPPAAKRAVDVLLDLVTAVVCAFLAYVAWRWLATFEIPEPRTLFTIPLVGAPFRHWWSLAVIPAGFALIGVRFALRALESAAGGHATSETPAALVTPAPAAPAAEVRP